ncbi:MAG TPA: hypothetical protein VF487_01755 [Chitinophagaceae bacterium]
MKTILFTLLIISVSVLQPACKRGKFPLDPPDKRPVQSIQIGDADEAALLQQELKIEIQQVKDNRLFYFAGSKDLDAQLTGLGYTIKKEDLMQLYYKYAEITINKKVPEESRAEELQKTGVIILNKEENYWVIRGTLEQLKQVEKMGYKLKKLEKEPRPRKVEIVVNTQADIQKVNETGVDIYHVETKDNSYIIHAGAFDNQIELIRKMGFTVTRK